MSQHPIQILLISLNAHAMHHIAKEPVAALTPYTISDKLLRFRQHHIVVLRQLANHLLIALDMTTALREVQKRLFHKLPRGLLRLSGIAHGILHTRKAALI